MIMVVYTLEGDKMGKNIKAHVVTHTHWDREWYMTYEIFRKRLLNLIDLLIENLPKKECFKHFMLDGQTVVLEDYLEMRPHKKDELVRLIKEGRISVGPWYILPDEFLIFGESFIRNFLVGKRVLEELGVEGMNIGYLPDMFGHNAYTPSILKGLGLKGAVIWRGVGRSCRETEFLWKSPNNDEIVTINLIRSYSNGAHFGRKVEDMKEVFKKEIEELSKHATTKNVLIMNGTDHEFPLFDLPRNFDEWSKELGTEIIHSSLEEYLNDVLNERPSLDVVIGELRDPKYEPVLKDVTSTRIYLKLKNFESQILYQRYLEPLSVLSTKKETLNEIEYGWKMILKSQPHDSICGCSLDRVHRDVDVRLSRAMEVGLSVMSDIFGELLDEEKEAIVVFNPYERERKAVVKGILNLDPNENWILVDDEGNSYDLYVEKANPIEFVNYLHTLGDNSYLEIIPFISRYLKASSTNVAFMMKPSRVIFQAPLPALGFKRFYLKKGTSREMKSGSPSLENDYYRFSLNDDGSFRVDDKVNGVTYGKLNFFEDIGDAGDEYNFSPVSEDVRVDRPDSVKIERVRDLGFIKEIELFASYRIPRELARDRRTRSNETLMVPLKLKYILFRDEPRVDILVEIENKAKDHKFTTNFIFPEEVDKIMNDSYFGLVEHPTVLENDEEATEEIVPRYAMESFLAVLGNKGKYMITTRGLHEYEVQKSGTTKISITLLRAIGWLSRGDLKTRKNHAGPYIPAPEAQCLGKYRYRYSFHILKEGSAEEMFENSKKFLLDPVLMPSSKLPENAFPRFIAEEGVFLSTLKISHKRDGIIIRFFNPTDEKKKLSFERDVEVVNMAEEPLGVKARDITMKPGEIVTVKFPLGG